MDTAKTYLPFQIICGKFSNSFLNPHEKLIIMKNFIPCLCAVSIKLIFLFFFFFFFFDTLTETKFTSYKYTSIHTYTKFLSYNIILGTIVLSILFFFFFFINVQFINHSSLTADAFSLASASPDIELIRRKSFNVLLPRKHIQIDFISEKLIFLRIHDETTEYG